MMTREEHNEGQESNLPDELASPARRALTGAGYTRLEQLARASEDEILKLHGMGPKAVEQLRRALAARDLSFAEDASTPLSEKNLSGYGAPPIAWDKVRERLEEGFTQAPETGGPGRHTTWLATVRPDGRPHVMPLGVLYVDGAFYFNAGPETRKAKNLARNPQCVLSIATHDFDLVIEGEAERVTDEGLLQRIADEFTGGGWEPTVRDGALHAEFSAPSAGPPPYYVYKVRPTTVYALGTAEPFGATRWRFES